MFTVKLINSLDCVVIERRVADDEDARLAAIQILQNTPIVEGDKITFDWH